MSGRHTAKYTLVHEHVMSCNMYVIVECCSGLRCLIIYCLSYDGAWFENNNCNIDDEDGHCTSTQSVPL